MKQFVVPVRRMLKQNIDAIREKRGIKTRKDLALRVHKSESWISKIYREDRRSFGLDDLNAIAEVLGVEVYHLFQPGFCKRMERRSGTDRRGGQERRISNEDRMIAFLRESHEKLPLARGEYGASAARTAAAAEDPIGRILATAAREVHAEFRRQIANTGTDSAVVPPRGRKIR